MKPPTGPMTASSSAIGGFSVQAGAPSPASRATDRGHHTHSRVQQPARSRKLRYIFRPNRYGFGSKSASKARTAASNGSSCSVTMLQRRACRWWRTRRAGSCRARGFAATGSRAGTPSIVRQVLDGLADDEEGVLRRAERRPAPVEPREGQAGGNGADARDLVQDVVQADPLTRVAHLEDAHRRLLDGGAQPPVKAVAGRVADRGAEPLLEKLVDLHEGVEAEGARRVGIDEQVDVGGRAPPRPAPRSRTGTSPRRRAPGCPARRPSTRSMASARRMAAV